MQQAGKPMERVKGRGKVYRLRTGETVNLRTSNDNNLVLSTNHPDPDKAQRRLKGDYILLVMPERQRTPGAVVAYFVRAEIA